MKNIHILYYTAAVLFAIAAIMSFINGGMVYGAAGILVAVGLFLFGSSQKAKQ